METNYIDLLFDGGIGEVRQILVQHIKNRANALGYDSAAINRISCLGNTLPKQEMTLPTYEEILADPTKLTTLTLSLLEDTLELDTFNALGLEGRIETRLNDEQKLVASESSRAVWGDREPTAEERKNSVIGAVQTGVVLGLGRP